MWLALNFIERISMGCRNFLWPTALGLFSVITTSTWECTLRVIILDTHTVAYKQLRPKIFLKIGNKQIWKLWSQKNEIRINLFVQYFVGSKPFKVTFTKFWLKNENWEIHFPRGEHHFSKIIKYSPVQARSYLYGTVWLKLCQSKYSWNFLLSYKVLKKGRHTIIPMSHIACQNHLQPFAFNIVTWCIINYMNITPIRIILWNNFPKI